MKSTYIYGAVGYGNRGSSVMSLQICPEANVIKSQLQIPPSPICCESAAIPELKYFYPSLRNGGDINEISSYPAFELSASTDSRELLNTHRYINTACGSADALLVQEQNWQSCWPHSRYAGHSASCGVAHISTAAAGAGYDFSAIPVLGQGQGKEQFPWAQ